MAHNPRLLPVTLDGTSYQVDVTRLRRRFLSSRAQQVEQEAGPPRLNPFGTLRHEITDWSLGAGQEFQDIETSSNRRFAESHRVDPFVEPGTLRLAARYSEVRNIGASAPATRGYQAVTFANAGNQITYWVNKSDGIERTLDPHGTWTALTNQPAGVRVDDMVVLPPDMYFAQNAAVHKVAAGGTAVTQNFSTDDFRRLWAIKGRLFGMGTGGLDANTLYEIDSAGVSTAVDTVASFEDVVEVVAGATAVYIVVHEPASGTFTLNTPADGFGSYRGKIYCSRVQSDGSLGAFTECYRLGPGESPKTMQVDGNAVLLTTTRGFRFGLINGDDTLTFGPLIDFTDEITGWPSVVTPYPMVQVGGFVYVGVTAFNQNGADRNVALLKFKLSEFTEPLVPAWALVADIGGTAKNPRAVVYHDRTVYYCDEQGFYGPSDGTLTPALYESGAVTSGWIRFGVTEAKIPRAIDVRHEALPAGATVKVYIIEEGGTETLIGTSSTAGTHGPDAPFAITGIGKGEKFRVKTELARATDTTLGPVVTSVTLHAIAVPSRTEEFVLPLVVASTVEDEIGGRQTFTPDTVYSGLRTLVRNRDVVTLEIGGESLSVIVENVELDPQGDTRWTDDRKGIQGVVNVTCHTADVEAS